MRPLRRVGTGIWTIGWMQERVSRRGGVPFSGGQNGVETMRGIGWSIAYPWDARVTDVHSDKTESEGCGREGQGDGIQQGGAC